MKRFKLKGFYILFITALLLSLFFSASTMAATEFSTDSGVYDLVGGSTNDHSQALYLWEYGDSIYVAMATAFKQQHNLYSLSINGVLVTETFWLPVGDNLKVKENGTLILDEMPEGKANANYYWLVGKVGIDFPVDRIIVNLKSPGGFKLENVEYVVQGALNVFHEYPPAGAEQDWDQSVASNQIGGLAPGDYNVLPDNPPSSGYEYRGFNITVDGIFLLSGSSGTGGTDGGSFNKGAIIFNGAGAIKITLTEASDSIINIYYLYGLAEYTVSLSVEPAGSGTVTGAGTYNYSDPVQITATPDLGWVFVNWTDDDNSNAVVSADVIYNFNMPANDVNYTANFEQIPGQCDCQWVEETAWAAGPRYTPRGNWATYTPYVANSTVTLYAGQHMVAGTVNFSAVVGGDVTITINLNNDWRFAAVSENIKIQGYASAPSGNPAPGRFAHKRTADTTLTSFSTVVPASNFYGVHVNVEWLDCVCE